MGPGVTVTVAVPLLPPALAVMVAGPARAPVTTPELDTVATPVLLEVHVTVYPSTLCHLASFTVAVNVVVDPDATLLVAGDTVIVATGARLTVTVAVPDLPSLVAVMVAVPGATPVTHTALIHRRHE
jgi:hypothetical protein